MTSSESSERDSEGFSSSLQSEPTPASVYLSLCAEPPEYFCPQQCSLVSAVSSACACLTIMLYVDGGRGSHCNRGMRDLDVCRQRVRDADMVVDRDPISTKTIAECYLRYKQQ